MSSIIPRCRPPSSPRKAPSPKRMFTTSTSRLVRALDHAAGLASTTTNGESSGPASSSVIASSSKFDPFGSSWPPRHMRGGSGTLATDGFAMADVTTLANNSTSAKNTESSDAPPAKASLPGGTKENGHAELPSKVPLPLYSYKDFSPSPTRMYVWHVDEADDLVDCLRGPVGFDLEWRTFFRRNAPTRPAATVQLSDERLALVIQLTAMSHFPKRLKALLENPRIPKIGVNILNDGNKLASDYNVRPQNLVELGGLARQADPDYVERYFKYAEPPSKHKRKTRSSKTAAGAVVEREPPVKMRKPGFMISLATITAMYTERRLAKGPVRTSNWEIVPLSETQLEYAANDAHCALMVYNRLHEMAKKAGVELKPEKYTQNVKYVYGPMAATHPELMENRLKSAFESGLGSATGGTASSVPSEAPKPASVSIPPTTEPHVSSVPTTDSTLPDSSNPLLTAATPSVPAFEEEESDDTSFEVLGPPKPYKPTGSSKSARSGVVQNVVQSTIPKTANELDNTDTKKLDTTTSTSSSSSAVRTSGPKADFEDGRPPPRPQQMRTYQLWHVKRLPVEDICELLRSKENPLKRTTVISYIVRALQAEPTLAFNHPRLGELLKMETSSWHYFGRWYETLDSSVYVNMEGKQ